LGGARGITFAACHENACHRTFGYAINVLFGFERGAGSLFVQVFRQRSEHQDAMDAVVSIERLDVFNQLFLGHVEGQCHGFCGDPD
jgi:hypothetical protein